MNTPNIPQEHADSSFNYPWTPIYLNTYPRFLPTPYPHGSTGIQKEHIAWIEAIWWNRHWLHIHWATGNGRPIQPSNSVFNISWGDALAASSVRPNSTSFNAEIIPLFFIHIYPIHNVDKPYLAIIPLLEAYAFHGEPQKLQNKTGMDGGKAIYRSAKAFLYSSPPN